jgi:hypothetical protein
MPDLPESTRRQTNTIELWERLVAGALTDYRGRFLQQRLARLVEMREDQDQQDALILHSKLSRTVTDDHH